MKHRVAIFLLLALTLFSTCFCAAATDTGYTGVIDPETGQPDDGQTDAAQASGSRTPLSGSMYYDWSAHDFVYPIGDALGEVHSSAADGMVLTTPVSVFPGSDASVTVYHNGETYTGNLQNCSSAGEYVVTALAAGQTRRLLGFTLVGDTTCALHTFVVPDGFYVISAERDGENVYMDRYNVDMEPEGRYVIEYGCYATDMVYTLETSIDRTPPVLHFKGHADSQGRIRSRLDFSGVQRGDSIYLTRSGTAVVPELNSDGTGSIYDPGNYTMVVTDAAGNKAEYTFIILQYFNLQSWIFFLIVIAAVGAVIGYILIQRKRLKIG